MLENKLPVTPTKNQKNLTRTGQIKVLTQIIQTIINKITKIEPTNLQILLIFLKIFVFETETRKSPNFSIFLPNFKAKALKGGEIRTKNLYSDLLANFNDAISIHNGVKENSNIKDTFPTLIAE